MKQGISLATIYSGPGRGDRRHVLEVWTQPWLRRLFAKTYHWYDMRIYKVPGFRQLERWLQSRHRGEELIYVPLRDIRCHSLTKSPENCRSDGATHRAAVLRDQEDAVPWHMRPGVEQLGSSRGS